VVCEKAKRKPATPPGQASNLCCLPPVIHLQTKLQPRLPTPILPILPIRHSQGPPRHPSPFACRMSSLPFHSPSQTLVSRTEQLCNPLAQTPHNQVPLAYTMDVLFSSGYGGVQTQSYRVSSSTYGGRWHEKYSRNRKTS
jgi:hypothetical protein